MASAPAALLVLVSGATGRAVNAQDPVAPSVASRTAATTDPEIGALLRLTDSLAAFGEAPRAYAMLDSAVRRSPRNGTLWHRFGMVAWQMGRPERGMNVVKSSRAVYWLAAADSALSLASEYAPDSARYALDLARFRLNSGWAPIRYSANRFTGRSLRTARRTGDERMIAEAADEQGILYWRRFELAAYRVMTSDGFAPDIRNAGVGRFARRDAIRSAIVQNDRKPWEFADFIAAVALFREAVAADPDYTRARRNLYMALAETGRWEELDHDARARIDEQPLDPVAWMAHGLAAHRLGESATALAAFDSAFVRLSSSEQQRLRTISRILRPKAAPGSGTRIADSAAFASLPPAQRDAMSRMYWVMANPLMLTGANEHEAEFQARLAFAELRWTQDDFDRKGADTDRGEVHIRYGPPDQQINMPGTSYWVYDNGLVFQFIQPAMYGTGRFTPSTREDMDRLRPAMPVSFDNVPITRSLDTTPTRVTRFRAGGDSSIVVVAADVAYDQLARTADEIDAVPVTTALYTIDERVAVRLLDSATVRVARDAMPAGLRRWTIPMGGGTNVVRIEALERLSRRAARAVVVVPALATTGLVMSDVLLAEPLSGAAADPRRWSDLAPRAIAGDIRVGTPIGLVWETYGLAADDKGTMRYDVAIDIERVGRGAISRLAARVVDGAGRLVGRTSQRRNAVSVSFPRSMPAAEVALDRLTLDLPRYEPGEYRLVVRIRDRVQDRRVAWETVLTLVAQ